MALPVLPRSSYRRASSRFRPRPGADPEVTPVDPSLAADHDELLELADHLTGVAGGGKPLEVEAAVLQLLERFERHTDREVAALVQVAPADERRLRRGQERVVDCLVDLLTLVATDPAGSDPLLKDRVRACVERLRLQVGDEQVLLA
jgi:hypothetical protein